MRRKRNTVNEVLKSLILEGRQIFRSMDGILLQMSKLEESPYYGRSVDALRATVSAYLSGNRMAASKTQESLSAALISATRNYLVENKLWENNEKTCEEFLDKFSVQVEAVLKKEKVATAPVQLLPETDIRPGTLTNCLNGIEAATKLVCVNIPLLPDLLKYQNSASALILSSIVETIEKFMETRSGSIEFRFESKLSTNEAMIWASLYALIGAEKITYEKVREMPRILAEKSREFFQGICSVSFTTKVTYASILTTTPHGTFEFYLPNGKKGQVTAIIRK